MCKTTLFGTECKKGYFTQQPSVIAVCNAVFKGMWYLRKVAGSCEQFGPVSTCLCPEYIQFCSQNLRNGKEY